ncbi:MAG: hypothetical protein GF329_16820 [Candidatus Lokiarchaeota archaeon]|nr:hypothetical protein [Candidatus Lokiarchaeota archaeon]
MSEKFLKWFIKFCGIIEIVIGIGFIFMQPLFELISIQTVPLFLQMAGVELTLLGFLLWYSARDIERFKIILIVSMVLRYVMPIFEIYTALTIPIMFVVLISTSIYDLASASLTLILLKKHEYLFGKKD